MPFCVPRWWRRACGVSEPPISERRTAMRIKALPEDFVVEEQVRLNPADSGPWAVYRVRKVGLTTLEVQT
ncbi:MAG: tRNA pseudouridine(13) synthase TruD, partial [Chloroflexi bacterium]|nr:tRNA pseudouridine(13) synthase TruD [Chloroflexota bacterium]